MSLLSLPNELLVPLAKNLEPSDIFSLILTNRCFAAIFTPTLHRRALRDYQQVPAIHWATQKGHLPLVRLLLNKGVSVNHSWKSRTPIITAAIFGRKAITKLLLDRGAAINAREDGGISALMQATSRGNVAVCRVLLEHGATDDCTEFCKRRGIPRVSSALHLAVSMPYASQSLVELLLKKCSNINDQNTCGRTALHLAIRCSGRSVIELLLKYGIDCDIQDQRMTTALHYAIWSSSLVKLLVQNGASTEIPNREGETALSLAASFGKPLSVKVLLEHGANPDARRGLRDEIDGIADRMRNGTVRAFDYSDLGSDYQSLV